MSSSGNPPNRFDLAERARQEMREEGFDLDFPPDAAAHSGSGAMPAGPDSGMKDLRALLWSSIDNRESRDLDQIEAAEQLKDGRILLRIGIADVDSLVPEGSPVDRHAAHNCCSVYTGIVVFPLLPEELSTDRTSLLQDQDRAAVIVEMEIDADGAVVTATAYRALTRNYAQLAYEEVGAWLEGEGPIPEGASRIEGMEAQLRLQYEIAERLEARRLREGALEFETVEAQPVVENGRCTDLAVPCKTAARKMIENFMISANTTMAKFLQDRGVGSIQRVVRSPQRWPRIMEIAARYGETLPSDPDPLALSRFLTNRRQADPERFPDLSLSIVKLMGPGEYTVAASGAEHDGHFGLAVYSYTHSTAPNRRYADLIVQRALKATLAAGSPPYTEEELKAIAARCTERENAARKVERFMRKAIAAVWMHDRIGETFNAIVTGANPKGTYVRLLHPPVEGRVVRGESGLDVGDHTRVRLIHTDPERGFIDFEHVP